MSANIIEVLKGNHRAMGEASAAKAREFGWDRSMKRLFGHVYPLAFRRSAERRALAATAPVGVFAEV